MTAVEYPGDLRGLARVVLDELRPRYAGLQPVVRDQVHRAVQDLRGSINIEALPEMANRLVTVRLDQHLTGTDDPPPDQPDTDHVG